METKLTTDANGKPYDNPECPSGNCEVVKELKREIAQLKTYSKIMQDTVTS